MTVRVHYPDGGRSWELGINFKFVGCIPQGQGSFARKIFNPFHVRKKNHRLRLSANLVNVCRHVGFHTWKLRVSVFFFLFLSPHDGIFKWNQPAVVLGSIIFPPKWDFQHCSRACFAEIRNFTSNDKKKEKRRKQRGEIISTLLNLYWMYFRPTFLRFFFSQNLTKSTPTGSVWERHCLSLLHGTKKWHWSGKWKQVDPNKPLEDDWNVKQVIYSQIGNRLCRQEICTYWRRWNWVPGA